MRLSSTVCLCLAIISTCASAAQPVIRLSDSCTIPTMPGKGSTKQDWDTYAALVRDYNECVSEKAAKYSKKTKEALESVGEKVTDWSDTAAGWFGK